MKNTHNHFNSRWYSIVYRSVQKCTSSMWQLTDSTIKIRWIDSLLEQLDHQLKRMIDDDHENLLMNLHKREHLIRQVHCRSTSRNWYMILCGRGNIPGSSAFVMIQPQITMVWFALFVRIDQYRPGVHGDETY